MRSLGVVLAVTGTAGACYATWAASSRHRPRDLAWAIAAPIALLLAMAGAILIFVPGFFD